MHIIIRVNYVLVRLQSVRAKRARRSSKERKREKERERERKERGGGYEEFRDQKARNEASQLVRERKEDDVDDESLARSEWERRRERAQKRGRKKRKRKGQQEGTVQKGLRVGTR